MFCINTIKTWLLITCSFFILNLTHAQDIEHLKDEKAFKFHGSVGLGVGLYTSNEAYASRDPFAWNLFGSFTPSVYGFDLPFSFLVTQYSRSYAQPFTQMGISPKYKWATLHLGYRSIGLSPLVFDGNSFLGAGVELKPGWFRFAAFYGRLNKAINEDTTMDRRMQPQFSRLGYGVSIGIESKGQQFSLQYFHATDVSGSISEIVDTLNFLKPQENSIVGSSWKFTFFKRIYFDGSIAASLLTRDMSYQAIDSIGDVQVPKFIKSIAPTNYSSVFSFSGQSSLRLNLKNFNAMLGYRRVQPDFLSLGTPYMLNDIELISTNAGTRLFKGKLSLNASYNKQRNNLNGSRLSTLKSNNTNLSVSTFISKSLNINANITTVDYFQKDGKMKLNDSIRMNQMMMAATIAPNYNFSTVNFQHNITGSLSITDLNDKNIVTKEQSEGNSINTSLNYSLYHPKRFGGINVGANYSIYNQVNNQFTSFGVNLGGNKQLLKEHNLSLNGNFGYYFNKAQNAPINNNIAFNIGSSFSKSKHQFGFSVNYIYTPPVDLNLSNKVNNVPYFVNTYNLSGNINYNYSF